MQRFIDIKRLILCHTHYCSLLNKSHTYKGNLLIFVIIAYIMSRNCLNIRGKCYKTEKEKRNFYLRHCYSVDFGWRWREWHGCWHNLQPRPSFGPAFGDLLGWIDTSPLTKARNISLEGKCIRLESPKTRSLFRWCNLTSLFVLLLFVFCPIFLSHVFLLLVLMFLYTLLFIFSLFLLRLCPEKKKRSAWSKRMRSWTAYIRPV